jgi:L-rhamnose mutarotase
MHRYGAIIKVRPEKLAEYKELHAKPWPGVLATLREHGISNYSIFHYDGLLFGYYEYHGDDYEADMAAIAADPITQNWWKSTDPCQEPMPSAADGTWWSNMEQVFLME